MIEAAIVARGMDHAGLVELIGTRLYPGDAPEDAEYPLVLYQQITTGAVAVRSLTGPAKHFPTLQQFDVFALTPDEASAVARQLRDCFDGHINQEWGGMTIPASAFDDEFDGNFEPDPKLHRKILQFRIVYQED